MANGERSVPVGEQAGAWREQQPETYRPNGTENLTYNNPYASEVERVWFDGKLVYALDCGEVELDGQGKLAGGREPEYVEGQYNIYDSVPGMEKYSPLWQFNYVVVGRDYEPNTLRSEADCLNSVPDREEHGRRELTRALRPPGAAIGQ